MRHATVVKGDVLLGNQAGSYACAEVGVEETRDLCRRDVAAALKEALGQDGDSILMGSHELGEHRGELNLVVDVGYGAMLPRKQRRERVHIVVVDARDVGVRDYNEWQVAQSLDATGEANRQQVEGEIGRGEKGGFGQRWTTMSALVRQSGLQIGWLTWNKENRSPT